MTESDIFIITNTYRNGHDNVISPFYVFDNSHKALSTVLRTVQHYDEDTSRPQSRGDGCSDDPSMAVKNALDDTTCQYCFDSVFVVSLDKQNHKLEMSRKYFMSSSDEVCSIIRSMTICGRDTKPVIMVVDVPRGLVAIHDGTEFSTATWDHIDDARKIVDSINFHDDSQRRETWRSAISPESLDALHEDRYGCLERSVEALLGIDPDDDMDVRKRDRVVRGLGGNNDEFLAAVVDVATRLRRDGENDGNVDQEACLDQACLLMFDMRMRYLDSEWELLEKELPDRLRENVVMHGMTTNDPNGDSCARWVDVLDENGRSRAHVSVGIGLHEYMLPNHVESGSVTCAFDLDGCFIVKEWVTVDNDDENGVPSPISDARIKNVDRHQADVTDRGELRNSILRAILRVMGEVRNDGERQEPVSGLD